MRSFIRLTILIIDYVINLTHDISPPCFRSPDRDAGGARQLQCHGQRAEATLQRHEICQWQMGKFVMDLGIIIVSTFMTSQDLPKFFRIQKSLRI